MKTLLVGVLALASLVRFESAIPGKVDYFRSQTFLLLVVFCLWIARNISRQVNGWFGIFFAFVGISAAYIGFFPTPLYDDKLHFLSTIMDAVTAQAFIKLLIISTIALALRRKEIKLFKSVFSLLCLFASGHLIFERIFYGSQIEQMSGLLGNASMTSSFIAVVLPMIRPHYLFLPIIAILISGSSTAIGIFAVVSFVYFYLNYSRPLAVSIALIVALLGLLLLGDRLLDPTGRLAIWQGSISYWIDHYNILLGTGPGTYAYFGHQLRKTIGLDIVWAHCDWLQIFLELGIVGIILSIICYVKTIFRSFDKEKWLAPSLFGYGLFMTTNMPLRFLLSAFFGAFLIRYTWLRNNESDYNISNG